MMQIPSVLTVSAVLCALVAHSAPAQSAGTGTRQDSVAACQNAARIVERGVPRHKQNEALARLVICGPIGAATVAGALDGTGAEQDTVTLGRFYADVDRWRDATIMSAAIRIARDGTASTQARVFAIRHLVWLAVPGAEYTYGSLIASPVVTPIPGGTRETRTCRHGFSSAHDNAFGTPLPGDYRAQLDAVFAQLDADSTQPVAVRNAARCGRE